MFLRNPTSAQRVIFNLFKVSEKQSDTFKLKCQLTNAQFYYSRAENKFNEHFATIEYKVFPRSDEQLIEYLCNQDHTAQLDETYQSDGVEKIGNHDSLDRCIADYLAAISIYDNLPEMLYVEDPAELFFSRDQIKEELFFSYAHLAYCYALKNNLEKAQQYIEKSIMCYDWAQDKKPHIASKHLEVPTQKENKFSIKWIKQYLQSFEEGREIIPAYLHLAEELKFQGKTFTNKK